MISEKIKENLTAAIMRSDTDEISLILDQLAHQAPEIITDVLAIMTDIAGKFILPASSLQSRKEDGWAFFNLDHLAGYEYPGLISGILKLQFPVLSTPPADQDLEKELRAAGFQISSPEHQLAFFKGWMANRANKSLETVANFLNKMNVSYAPDQLSMLEWLIRADLAPSIRLNLAQLLKKLSAARAGETGNTIRERYLQEVLHNIII